MHQRARTDPSGGRGATRVPTGTQGNADLEQRCRYAFGLLQLLEGDWQNSDKSESAHPCQGIMVQAGTARNYWLFFALAPISQDALELRRVLTQPHS
jgi:hypothetical protein